MIGRQIFVANRVAGEEQALPVRVGEPRRGGTGDEQADRDVA
jgi:hypothetical protein